MNEPEQEHSQDLSEKFSTLSDDELFNLINIEFRRYRPEALAAARDEMLRRGYRISKKGKITNRRKKHTKPKESPGPTGEKTGPVQCRRCGAELDYAGTRRMHEEKNMAVLAELGEMFKKGAPEMLDVYICKRCGCVELYVEGIGDELRPF
jgi:hypothetical protein